MALFHATDRETDGNQNRRCRMQRLRWTPTGPDMGGYVGAYTKDVDVFLQEGKEARRSGHAQEEGMQEAGALRNLIHALKGEKGSR